MVKALRVDNQRLILRYDTEHAEQEWKPTIEDILNESMLMSLQIR